MEPKIKEAVSLQPNEKLINDNILTVISYGMLYSKDWFTPEEVKRGLSKFSINEIIDYLLNASGHGFFTYCLKEDKYLFKRTAIYIS